MHQLRNRSVKSLYILENAFQFQRNVQRYKNYFSIKIFRTVQVLMFHDVLNFEFIPQQFNTVHFFRSKSIDVNMLSRRVFVLYFAAFVKSCLPMPCQKTLFNQRYQELSLYIHVKRFCLFTFQLQRLYSRKCCNDEQLETFLQFSAACEIRFL